MKKTVFFTMALMFMFTVNTLIAGNKDLKTGSEETGDAIKTENTLSEEEISLMTKRVEEIRDMDKSEMNSKERKELRKELREIKSDIKKSGGTVYISGGALILIIILVILLV